MFCVVCRQALKLRTEVICPIEKSMTPDKMCTEQLDFFSDFRAHSKNCSKKYYDPFPHKPEFSNLQVTQPM